MPKTKRKAVYDPAEERRKWVDHFRDRYLNMFLSKWKIEGATEEEDRYVKRTLYLGGKVSAWRATDDLVVFSDFAPNGFNIYGTPLSGLPIKTMGATFFPDKPLSTYAVRNNEARGVEEPEIVLGYALPNKRSVFSQIEALVNERVEIAMTKATEEGGISCVNTGIPYLLDKLEAYDQNIDGKILSILGIDNSGARKMEREVVDEVNANNALINLSSGAFETEVSGFLERVNGAFGTGFRLVDMMPKVDSFHDGEGDKNDGEGKKEEIKDEIRD